MIEEKKQGFWSRLFGGGKSSCCCNMKIEEVKDAANGSNAHESPKSAKTGNCCQKPNPKK